MLEEGSGPRPLIKIDDFVSAPSGKAISLFLSESGKPYARLYYDPTKARWMALSADKDEVTDGSVRCFVFGQDRSSIAVVQPLVGRRLRIMRFTRDKKDVHGRLI